MSIKQTRQIWYRFYIEPYFDKDDIARLKQSLQQSNDTLRKQFSDKKLKEQHFPILLPFMLSNEKFDNFVQNYLNIGLHHCRNFSNAQNMIRANITQLDILSYKEDSFYRHFVELAKIDQEINKLNNNADEKQVQEIKTRLDLIKELSFEDFENTKESLKECTKDIESKKKLIEAKYIASWHIAYIRLISYGEKYSKDETEKAREDYKNICKQVDSGINELKELESWDYDIAMLYLALQGYKFIGARLHFLDTPQDLQEKYQQAFKDLDSICKGNDSRDNEITNKIQPHLKHPHIKAYIEYYRFLYIQRKFELAAKEKNLKEFKQYLYEAQNLIDQLLIDNTQHTYLFTKMKKHKANIMNLIWHIELKEIGRQLEDPFNIELKDNADNKGAYDILSKSNKLYKHIESMLKTNTNPCLKNPKNT
ncbi:MAG: hypothetical protein SPJ83_00975 [Helicobacter sp.]|uniref:hypothetical protein n=1 Tax=Helicobacter sp. TaxID=218 RepID=UPI002A9110AE|nr:hypothetical protein [Helicobacter sp.]MDY5821360.1 hypothetical protein [Helicobacter sp.]